MKRCYCSTIEVIKDLAIPGDNGRIMDFIRSASTYIDRKIGQFIPSVETRHYTGDGRPDLYIDPLLAITTIKNDLTTLVATDYSLQPNSRYWENGPYSRITLEYGTWYPDLGSVEITGRWGKYEETALLAASVSQLIGDSTLVLTNGSLASPGNALLIQDEQELVTGYGATTTATSKTNGALDVDDESITVDNGAEFFEGETLIIDLEKIYIHMINGHLLYVTRGWDNTRRATHIDDSVIKVYRTLTVERALNGTTAAAHTTVGLYKYMPPADVNFLCREMAALMYQKAKTGYIGRSGNEESGESFYISAFPSDIKRLQDQYRIRTI
jgi:hypothetical protein